MNLVPRCRLVRPAVLARAPPPAAGVAVVLPLPDRVGLGRDDARHACANQAAKAHTRLSGTTTVTTAPGIATTLVKAGILPLPTIGTQFGIASFAPLKVPTASRSPAETPTCPGRAATSTTRVASTSSRARRAGDRPVRHRPGRRQDLRPTGQLRGGPDPGARPRPERLAVRTAAGDTVLSGISCGSTRLRPPPSTRRSAWLCRPTAAWSSARPGSPCAADPVTPGGRIGVLSATVSTPDHASNRGRAAAR